MFSLVSSGSCHRKNCIEAPPETCTECRSNYILQEASATTCEAPIHHLEALRNCASRTNNVQILQTALLDHAGRQRWNRKHALREILAQAELNLQAHQHVCTLCKAQCRLL